MANPVEVPRRFEGEDQDAYTRRALDVLLGVRMRVAHARIERLEATVSTLATEVDHLHTEVTEARSRTDRLVESVGNARADILTAIAAEKAKNAETCKAIAAGMGDAVRAVGASPVLSAGVIFVALLAVVVFGAWLLDLSPNVTTDYGSVRFDPKPVPAN